MLIHLNEDPLGPLIVIGIDGGNLFAPVVGEAKGLDLILEVRDVLPGEDLRMLVVLDRELLSRKAEGIPAHWMEDVIALHSLHTADDVSGRISLRVSDMKTLAGWIREHIQRVEFWFGEIVSVAIIGVLIRPDFAPLLLNV